MTHPGYYPHEARGSAELPPNLQAGVYGEPKTAYGESMPENQDGYYTDARAGIFVVTDTLGSSVRESAPGQILPGQFAAEQFGTFFNVALNEGRTHAEAAEWALIWTRRAMTQQKAQGHMAPEAKTTLNALCIDPETGVGVTVQVGDSFGAKVLDDGMLDFADERQELPRNPGESAMAVANWISGVEDAERHAWVEGDGDGMISGHERAIFVDSIRPITLQPGSRYVLGSDGMLTGFTANDSLESAVRFNAELHPDPSRVEYVCPDMPDWVSEVRRTAALQPNPDQAAQDLVQYGACQLNYTAYVQDGHISFRDLKASAGDRGYYEDDATVVVVDFRRRTPVSGYYYPALPPVYTVPKA